MSFFSISLLFLYGLVVILNLVFALSFSTLLQLLLAFVVVMFPSAIFLFVGRMLPKTWFNEKRKYFKINKFQNFVCKITNVKKWKDKIPVGMSVNGVKADKLANPKDIEYLNRFIYESCFADWLHTTCALWGLLSLVIFAFANINIMLKMALPIAIIFFYQNMMSIIIQWFMRPRIVKLKENVEKRILKENVKNDENN